MFIQQALIQFLIFPQCFRIILSVPFQIMSVIAVFNHFSEKMKTTTKLTIDMLTERGVSINTQIFIEFDGEEKEIKNNRKAYVNSDRGRKELQTEQPDNIVNAVFAVWGDQPTVLTENTEQP